MTRGWEESHLREAGRARPPPNNAKGGIYHVQDDLDLRVEVALFSIKLEELESKGPRELKAMQDSEVQPIQRTNCFSWEHQVSNCPSLLTTQEGYVIFYMQVYVSNKYQVKFIVIIPIKYQHNLVLLYL